MKGPKQSVKYLQLKKRKCPVCNSDKKTSVLNVNKWRKMDFSGKVYIIDKKYCICNVCSLVYTNPTVNPKIFDRLYENSIVGSFFNSKNSKNIKKIKTFAELSKKYLNNKFHVLEIGCGSGVILKYLSIKFKFKKKNLTGIEPSVNIYKELRFNRFFQIYNKFLDNLTTKKKYDFIIMDNVFEHFEYPRKSLKKINQILKENGIIYIAIPNTEIIKTISDDPFNHTCNYNTNNIRTLLNNFNLKVLRINKKNNQLNIIVKKENTKKIEFKENIRFKKKLKLKIDKIKFSLKKIKLKLFKISTKVAKGNKKIVIFGAGNYSLWILNILQINKHIKYGVDNNNLYQNKLRNNIKIYNPSKLKDNDYDFILILSGVFKKDITNQIIKMGINPKKILSI